jgi:hypothetical protein
MFTVLLLRLKIRSSEPIPFPQRAHDIFDAILVTNLLGDMVLHHGIADIHGTLLEQERFGQRCLRAYVKARQQRGANFPESIVRQTLNTDDPVIPPDDEIARRLCEHCAAENDPVVRMLRGIV